MRGPVCAIALQATITTSRERMEELLPQRALRSTEESTAVF
jgi:hypothetical protein